MSAEAEYYHNGDAITKSEASNLIGTDGCWWTVNEGEVHVFDDWHDAWEADLAGD